MPLITMCGIPASGKTTCARRIEEYFRKRFVDEGMTRNSIHFINDNSLGISKESYKYTGTEEKNSRGALLSSVERLVSKEDVVIADGVNYIKGFRYQLYCVARAVGTPHCVVYCGTPVEKARTWNSSRPEGEERYEESVFDDLVSRFEEPNDRNRWDSPLFTVIYDDPDIPCDDIWQAVMVKKAKPPNLSTVVKPVSETNYLYELEKTTQEIINQILEVQKNSVGVAELRRLRRQFTNINKMHTLLDMNRVAELFVEYLNTNVNR
ncbi:702_t:CDS:2 [Ambispora gerdemannii]|uniref:702_t:CDS:1 n=1 Tax=Ambispora gerdemannii TaxID=144530 RepID=A0A9N9G7R7_9GLOM|nr:702_t:CDS:2 [Ambispora gerdemannii]